MKSAPWQSDWYQAMTQSQQAKQKNIAKCRPNERIRIAKAPDMAAYWSDSSGTAATTACTIDTFDLYNTTTSNMYVTGTSSTDTWIITTNRPANGVYITPQAQSQYVPPPSNPTPDPRILNKYLNAADLLEEFIKDLAPLGVRQGEVLEIPIELFINWLVVRAAEEDGHDAPDDIPALPSAKPSPRCKCCGRFIPRANLVHGLTFCNGEHADRYLERIAA